MNTETSLHTEDAPEKDCCDVTVIHDDIVAKNQKSQLSERKVTDMALLFQAMSDPTRIRMIHTLIQEEMCVCDLAAVLEMTQSNVSHQLRTLRNLRLVKHRKVGRQVYYSIDDEHVLHIFETGISHVSHT